MATTPTDTRIEPSTAFVGAGMPAWPRAESASVAVATERIVSASPHSDALQALLAFSALHEQVRRRKSLAAKANRFDAPVSAEFEGGEQFLLNEVLQLVAERALTITGGDGIAIALAENNEIVLRASAGTIRPDVGARIDRDSAFSGVCFNTAQVVTCDDTETDARVNINVCRKLGARSMIAVPLCGRRRVIGLLEAFSVHPFAFNDSDVQNLTLLAELVLGALKPADEDRFAESARVAATELNAVAPAIAPLIARVPVISVASANDKSVSATPTPVDAVAVAASLNPALTVEKTTTEPAPVEAASVAVGVNATAVETDLKQPELERTDLEQKEKRSRINIILPLFATVVIACAGVAGIWWKTQTEQIGKAMVRAALPAAAQPEETETTKSSPTPSTNLASNSNNGETIDVAGSMPSASDAESATSAEISRVPKVTGIRHWTSADSSTVVLDLEDQVQYEAHRLSNPERIYFDLRDTKLAPELEGKTVEVADPLLNRIRVAQPEPGMTRVVLETKANTTYGVSLEPNPYRLVVKVSKVGATPQSAVNLFPGSESQSKLAIVVPPPTKEDLQLRARVSKMRIVVDAGHGGWDLGTVGRRGLLEKDLVLEIAQRLGKLLESRLGADVVYTRQDDNYVPLDERAGIANQSQADLFVSVHANYSDLPSARGVETYYTNFFSAPNAKDLETRANAGGAKPSVTAALSPADLHERIEQSRRLAASVQRSLYGTLSVENPGLRDRGIKEAGFVVLTETAMPGILAEVSFVSSPTDEQRLRSDGYREQIAEALYKGIARYAASSKGVKVAEKQSLVVSR